MPTGVELATAWVRLVPSFDGSQAEITKGLGDIDTESAGKKAGEGYKKSFVGAAAIGSAIGNVVAQVAVAGAQALGDLLGEAVQASDATDKFKSSLEFAGLDTTTIDKVSKQVRAYADNTVYDLGTIQNTTAQLAANGVPNYEKITEAAGNLNAVAGGNQETFKSVAMALTQTAGAGKLTTENWNQLAEAVPGAAGVLQDALLKSGAYTGNFRDAMAKGEITADEFNQALLTVGSKPIAVEAAKSTKTFEGAVGNLSATIVGKLSDAFTAIKPFVTAFISGFSDFISNAKVFLPVIGGIAAVILAALMPALIAAIAATWAWTAALLANPMTWIVLAIGALIAIIILLIMNWDAVVKFLQDVWANVVSWFNDTLAALGAYWNDIWTNIVDFFTTIWTAVSAWFMDIVNNIASFFTTIWTNVSDFFTTVWQTMVNIVMAIIIAYFTTMQTIFNAIADFFKMIWNGISSFFIGAWNNIVNTVTTVVKVISDAISGALTWISNTWNGMWQGMVDFLAKVFTGIVGVVKAPINGIISLINGAIGAINSIHITIPDWVPLIGGQTWGLSLPKIPMLATGGTITASGMTIVGENGPELLKLPKGAQVNPNYDDMPNGKTVEFKNYAPLGQTPAQALTEFSNRAKGL